MELLETEKAYIAGIIDGEGCIYIDKFIDKRTKKYTYCLRMKVSMTCLKTVTWLRNTVLKEYKCNLHVAKGKKFERCKQGYVFAFSTRDLPRFCEAIYPYMITKKERCKLAMEYAQTHFMNNRSGRTGTFLAIPDHLREKKEDIYKKIKHFNQNGEK